jgi:hypothetical protein
LQIKENGILVKKQREELEKLVRNSTLITMITIPQTPPSTTRNTNGIHKKVKQEDDEQKTGK